MKQERLKILSMLEDGKITADEAARLLESCHGHRHDNGYCDWDDDWTYEEMEDRVNRFSRSAERFGKDFKNRMQSVYKDVEPKLDKAAKTVLEKSAAIIDDISCSINETIRNMDKKYEEFKEKVDDVVEDVVEDNPGDDAPREN